MTDKICGNPGCRNDAVGTIPKHGRDVWTCKDCADGEIEGHL